MRRAGSGRPFEPEVVSDKQQLSVFPCCAGEDFSSGAGSGSNLRPAAWVDDVLPATVDNLPESDCAPIAKKNHDLRFWKSRARQLLLHLLEPAAFWIQVGSELMKTILKFPNRGESREGEDSAPLQTHVRLVVA